MRQIGEPSGQQLWEQQTSGNNELDGEKKDNRISSTSLSHIWRESETFCQTLFLYISHESGAERNRPPARMHILF